MTGPAFWGFKLFLVALGGLQSKCGTVLAHHRENNVRFFLRLLLLLLSLWPRCPYRIGLNQCSCLHGWEEVMVVESIKVAYIFLWRRDRASHDLIRNR